MLVYIIYDPYIIVNLNLDKLKNIVLVGVYLNNVVYFYYGAQNEFRSKAKLFIHKPQVCNT